MQERYWPFTKTRVTYDLSRDRRVDISPIDFKAVPGDDGDLSFPDIAGGPGRIGNDPAFDFVPGAFSGMGSLGFGMRFPSFNFAVMERLKAQSASEANREIARKRLIAEGFHAEVAAMASRAIELSGYHRHTGRLVPGFPSYDDTNGRPEWSDTPEAAYMYMKMVADWIVASEANVTAAVAADAHGSGREQKAEDSRDLIKKIVTGVAIAGFAAIVANGIASNAKTAAAKAEATGAARDIEVSKLATTAADATAKMDESQMKLMATDALKTLGEPAIQAVTQKLQPLVAETFQKITGTTPETFEVNTQEAISKNLRDLANENPMVTTLKTTAKYAIPAAGVIWAILKYGR